MASNGNSCSFSDNKPNTNESPWKSSASQASRDNSLGTLSTRATVGTNSSHSTRSSREFAETDTDDPTSRDMLTNGIGSWTEAARSHRAAAIDDVVQDSHPAEPVRTALNEPITKGKVNEQSVNAVGDRRSDGDQKK